MKNFLLILLILLLSGAAFAQGKVYEPIYWFYGRVLPTSDAGVAGPDGRMVITYYQGLPPDLSCASDEVGPRGAAGISQNYIINLMADYRNIPDAATTYEVATIRGADGYGAGPVAVTIDGSGVKRIPDMTLMRGGGVVPVDPPPEGSVRLTISREGESVGANIRVSWVAPIPINLYALTGPGTGVYTNEVSAWHWIDPAMVVGYNFYPGYVIHSGQVRAGTSEVYYKALIAGLDPYRYLASAEAVGKFNMNIGTGFNLISIPFATTPSADATVERIFGRGQLTSGGPDTADALYYKPSAGLPNYLKAYLSSTGWVGGSVMEPINPALGYFLEAHADKIVTVVGEVALRAGRTVKFDPDYTIFGILYPRPLQLTGGRTNPIEGAFSGGPDTADAIYYKPNAALPNYLKAYLSGASWTSGFDPKPPFGYFYERKAASFTWNHEYLDHE